MRPNTDMKKVKIMRDVIQKSRGKFELEEGFKFAFTAF